MSTKADPGHGVYLFSKRAIDTINRELSRIVVSFIIEWAVKKQQFPFELNNEGTWQIIEIPITHRDPFVYHKALCFFGTGLSLMPPNGFGLSPLMMFTCLALRAPERVSSGFTVTVPPPATISFAVATRISP